MINQIANDSTKVIIVDLTGEYKEKIPGLTSIVSEDDSKKISTAIENLAKENAKYPDKRDQNIIAAQEKVIKETFKSSIEAYLTSALTKTVFELSEITNNSSSLDYTRWFFWVLFNVAKFFQNYGKRVCVVLEEAHTIIPEISTMGVSDNASKATVNSIAQIALQGRKYNIGFIVIAQRTANVSKTVLTQCNSVIVFQELDKTTSDFLANYMGKSFVDISGIASAWVKRELSSRVGIIGIVKKLAYLLAVAVAIVVDWVVQTAAVELGVDLGGFYFFGLLVTIWLVLNECISILENLSEIGVPLPAFLLKIIEKLEKTVEETGEKPATGNGGADHEQQ